MSVWYNRLNRPQKDIGANTQVIGANTPGQLRRQFQLDPIHTARSTRSSKRGMSLNAGYQITYCVPAVSVIETSLLVLEATLPKIQCTLPLIRRAGKLPPGYPPERPLLMHAMCNNATACTGYSHGRSGLHIGIVSLHETYTLPLIHI